MRAVNLLPVDRASARSRGAGGRSLLLPAIGVVTVGAIAGLVFAVSTMNSSVTSKQQQLNALQAKIAKLPKLPPVTAATASPTPSRKTTVVSLVGARLPWDEFLGTFSRVVPENVWLSSLQATTPGAAAIVAADEATAGSTAGSTSSSAPASGSTTPGSFTISGYTYSQPSVARLMRRLTLIPWLSDISLVSSTQATIGSATVYQFTVGATVVPQPGGAS